MVTESLNEFLGFDTDVSLVEPTRAGFVADVEKRDAVKAAFRVSIAAALHWVCSALYHVRGTL